MLIKHQAIEAIEKATGHLIGSVLFSKAGKDHVATKFTIGYFDCETDVYMKCTLYYVRVGNVFVRNIRKSTL